MNGRPPRRWRRWLYYTPFNQLREARRRLIWKAAAIRPVYPLLVRLADRRWRKIEARWERNRREIKPRLLQQGQDDVPDDDQGH